jgi:hypothetical protein
MKDFLEYPEALALKELGFDEPCLAWYGPNGRFLADITIGYEKTDWLYNQQDMDNPRECIAPTLSQAFRWFREKYNLFGQVNIRTYYIYEISNDGIGIKMVSQYDKLLNTYEEAELACLQKLIEIVKTK